MTVVRLWSWVLVVAFVALWMGSIGMAGEGASPEHGKINTADASPVDLGHFEVESSYFYSRAKRYWDDDGDSRRREPTREHCVGLSVTAGVWENLDLNVSSCYRWVRDDENDYDEDDSELGPRSGDHFGDLDFGGRYRFLKNDEHKLEMAYIAGFTAPTGSGNCRREIGTSQEFWSLNQSLVITKDWGRWTANAETGYSLSFGEHRDDSRGVLSGNLAAGYQVLPWLQPELELNYSREYLDGGDEPEVLAGTAGLVMPVNERLRFTFGVQGGLWGRNTDQAPSFFLGIKLVF